MFTYNILIYQFEPEPLILRGFPALLIHLSVENGRIQQSVVLAYRIIHKMSIAKLNRSVFWIICTVYKKFTLIF